MMLFHQAPVSSLDLGITGGAPDPQHAIGITTMGIKLGGTTHRCPSRLAGITAVALNIGVDK